MPIYCKEITDLMELYSSIKYNKTKWYLHHWQRKILSTEEISTETLDKLVVFK